MNENVLVIFYSQTGQLQEIAEAFSGPLKKGGCSVEIVRVEPADESAFAFPWNSDRFFQAMPGSVLGKPVELKDFQFQQEDYDLIIFAYQPWFLSPSIPATSILNHPKFRQIIKNTPVITLIGARNMWLNAQERVKEMLKELGATLVGNIALADKNHNIISAITILYWMFVGKKDRLFGIFPPPGISKSDIAGTEKFGEKVLEKLFQKKWDDLQQELVALKAVEVDSDLMFIESRAGKIFSIWANFIFRKKDRTFWLRLFKYYLIIALFIVAPPVLAINKLFFRPFMGRKIKQQKNYYLGIN